MTYEQTKQGKPLRPEKKLTNSAKRLNNMVRRLYARINTLRLVASPTFTKRKYNNLSQWCRSSSTEITYVWINPKPVKRIQLIHHGNFDFRDLLPWAFASTLELLVVSLGARVP